MTTAILGLVFAFLLLATTVGYLIIKTNLNPIIKVVIIIFLTWYSIALYAAPGQIAGHPKMVDEIPDGVWILSGRIVEPKGIDPGGIYFWVYDKKNIEEVTKLTTNPFEAFKQLNRKAPRAYGIPYDKELHKKYTKALKKQKGKGGILSYKRGKKGKEGGIGGIGYKPGTFKIFNPSSLLPPKG